MTKTVEVTPDGDKVQIVVTTRKNTHESTWFKSITIEQAEELLIRLLPLVLSAKSGER